jgi:hypothetical protein
VISLFFVSGLSTVSIGRFDELALPRGRDDQESRLAWLPSRQDRPRPCSTTSGRGNETLRTGRRGPMPRQAGRVSRCVQRLLLQAQVTARNAYAGHSKQAGPACNSYFHNFRVSDRFMLGAGTGTLLAVKIIIPTIHWHLQIGRCQARNVLGCRVYGRR